MILRPLEFRRDIQVLRGLAVLAVVLFHAEERFFPLGYLGVDVFFVISGFVVTPLILRIFIDPISRGQSVNLLSFYKRRFYRLAPALAVTLAISAITMFLFAPVSEFERFASQGIATVFILGNFGAYKYSGDYFSPNPNPLVHTWSLSLEEQIYILLPAALMILICNRKKIKKITALVFVCISVISFTSFLFPTILQPFYSRIGIELASQFSFYSPIDRIWQFTLGGLAYFALNRFQNPVNTIPRGMQRLIVIAITLLLFGSTQVSLKTSSILASLLSVIVILSKSIDVLPKLLANKLEWVGDRSYSIYLVHMPLLYLAKYSPLLQIGHSENRIVQSVFAFVLSILLGSLSYSRVENRYRNTGANAPYFSRKYLKGLASFLIGPLVIFLTLTGISGTNSKSMYEDRLDNGICKFWTSKLDGEFHSRFLNCNSKFGPAVVVLGDSHAMNIYNSMFLRTSSDFFLGISMGGCRPNTQSDSCHYDDFRKLLESAPHSIKQVIFHQSGSYLISDEQGNVDSNRAFRSQTSYRILGDEIQFLLDYLNDLGKNIATTWIGPFPELRVDPTWIQLKANQVKPNPFVKKAFLDLEKEIDFYLTKESKSFRYVSLTTTLGERQFKYRDGTCILFRDIDHWSACGEEKFSFSINQSLK